MKKIIILAIALLSTGIGFSAINSKKETVKNLQVKEQKADFSATHSSIDRDALATAD